MLILKKPFQQRKKREDQTKRKWRESGEGFEQYQIADRMPKTLRLSSSSSAFFLFFFLFFGILERQKHLEP